MQKKSGYYCAVWMVALLAACAARAAAPPSRPVGSDSIVLKNRDVQRVLRREGDVWRTTRMARADGSDPLTLRSDEFHVLLPDDTQLTLEDYAAVGQPRATEKGGEQRVTIRYRLRDERRFPEAAPRGVTITYRLADEPYLRKDIVLEMAEGQAIDRLEVERFVCGAKARRGGRGEPVFLNETWFAGLEYPASYIRHGRNFQYRDYGLRNPSKIFLDGRDQELGDTPEGLVTMAHFPGLAKKRDATGRWLIEGKTSVFGIGRPGDSIELAFLDYLQTIRRAPPRSYLHHNNWFDRSSKDLSVENYIGRSFRQLRDGLAPYGVHLDAMVPDNGWQNRSSIWQPKADVDLVALRRALEKQSGGKTRLGLWIALNGYNLNVDWGAANGYVEARRNEWFQRFKRYYALTQPEYNAAIREALRKLITDGNLGYFKHDFNEMCDLGGGCGHLPTDRHGHEASVDAMIDLLAYERQLQPDIFQNLTNWIWFSPWWLMHADCLWMMGSDSGSNWSWPQLAVRDVATTFRDAHFARLWTDPQTRPLIPISALMTHGIIFADRNRRGDDQETTQDWANYVMMYYGRGVMLKELYLTPSMMTPDRWKVLGMATRWATANAPRLVNAVAVGGNPERGKVYGYVSWTRDSGILTVRNPDRRRQVLRVPFDQTTWYRAAPGQPWHGRVIYPYVEPIGRRFTSGRPLQITVPGDSVMVFELAPGEPAAYQPVQPAAPPRVAVGREAGQVALTIAVPDEDMLRCDVVIQVYEGSFPHLVLNGRATEPDRRTHGRVARKRQGAAAAGSATGPGELPSVWPTDEWTIASLDLRPYRGRTVTLMAEPDGAAAGPPVESAAVTLDAWLIADRVVQTEPAPEDEPLPFAISQQYRRQTVRVLEPCTLAAP